MDTVLCTLSKMKLICVPTHYYWSFPFSAVNSAFFLTFSHVYQIYVAEVLIIHVLQVLPSKVIITIWLPNWGQFFAGGQLHLHLHICVVPFGGPLHLCLQSHISLTLDHGGSTLSSVLFILILYALHLHKPYFFYISSTILITLNDNVEHTVLCRLSDFFKDEIDMCSYPLLLVNFFFCMNSVFF